jgi:hypothetical protein
LAERKLRMFDRHKSSYGKRADGTLYCSGALSVYFRELQRWYRDDFEVKESKARDAFFYDEYAPRFSLYFAASVHYAAHSLKWDERPMFAKTTKRDDLENLFKRPSLHDVLLRERTYYDSPGEQIQVEISFNPWVVLCFLADNLPKDHLQFMAPRIRPTVKHYYQPKARLKWDPQVGSNVVSFVRTVVFKEQLTAADEVASSVPTPPGADFTEVLNTKGAARSKALWAIAPESVRFSPMNKNKKSDAELVATTAVGGLSRIPAPVNSSELAIPMVWDELAITRQLRQLRDERPGVIGHFLESVKERFVLRQDDRTAQVRLDFLKSQVEQLKLAKDFQQAYADLNLVGMETAKRAKSLEVDTHELELKRRSLSRKDDLETQREQKKLELELAEMEAKIQQLKQSTVPQSALTAAQRRAQEYGQRQQEFEERIQELRHMKAQCAEIEDEAERAMRENAISDAIQREHERWGKSL